MLKRHNIVPLFQVQEKLKACRSLNSNFLSSCFIADDSHTKIVWLHMIAFSGHEILHFLDNFHLLKHYSLKVPQNCYNSFIYSNQSCIQYKFPNFHLR